MKTKLMVFALLLTFAGVNAQSGKVKHFEVKASVNFWTPTSMHLKTSNSVTQYSYPNGTYMSEGAISGYGTSLAPGINVKYFFNDNIGISLGLCIINMDNELFVQETDTSFSSYENMAQIDNLNLGITGRYVNTENFRLYYEAGIDLALNYDLEMQYSTESTDPPDMDALGSALGLYCKTGAEIRIVGSLFFNSAFAYSYIPVEIEYTNSEGSAKINEKTDLGGIWLETGLSYNF
jgi:outer membrane protein W